MLVIVSFVCRSVVDVLVPSLIGKVYVYPYEVCGTSLCVQYFDNPNGSNSRFGSMGQRMGLHIRLGVDYPLQVGVVVAVEVLQVYWVLPVVDVLPVLVVVPALVQDVRLYSVPGVLLPVVGHGLLVLIVRKVMPIDILLS